MSKKYGMSRNEARKYMEKFKSSSFWQNTRNQSLLQEVIDVLYNSVEGNDYSVACAQNQYSERLKIVCHICKTDLSSYDPFMSHDKGKSHKKVLQQILSPKDPNLSIRLQRKSLTKEKGVFDAGSLEDDIDTYKHYIIGVHFLYKEMINGEECFTCTLCKKDAYCNRISKEEMYHHLTRGDHSARYLEEKFGYTSLRPSELKYQVERIAQKEGQIHGEIVDFSKQLKEGETITVKLYQEVGESSDNCSKRKVKYHPGEFKCKSEPKIPTVSQVPTVDKSVGCSQEDHKDMQSLLDFLTKDESRNIVASDGDMQSLLIHFNWLLADCLVKYYEQHKDEYVNYENTAYHLLERARKRVEDSTKLTPYVYVDPK